MKHASIERVVTVTLITLLLMPLLAGADPFVDAGNQAKSYFMQLITPIVGIAVLVVGVLCFTGRIAWAYMGATLAGVLIIFGHEQIVTMFRSWGGV